MYTMNMGTFGKTIILFGLKSSCKITNGKLLSKQLELPFYDTDYVIQKISGISPRDLSTDQGLSAYMQAEESACKKILEITKDKNAIISTGSTICDNAPALHILRTKGNFYFLKEDPAELVYEIMKNVSEPQPGLFINVPTYILKKKPENIEEIEQLLLATFTERLQIYESIADKIIEIKKAPQKEVFKTILEAL